MRKLLPVIFALFIVVASLHVFIRPVSAQPCIPGITAPTCPTSTSTSGTTTGTTTGAVAEGEWYKDSEVTFIGKNAARSGLLLDWTLRNYDWSFIDKTQGDANPLIPFWAVIRNIVLYLLAFFVLVSAFILIVTRGKSIAARKFIPRFIAFVLLIVFSFSLIQFLYQIADIIQGFFIVIRPNDPSPLNQTINQKDLLYVGWDYREFQGLKRFGDLYAESAFISLLLTKLTAITYYVMIGILIVRKIILWFFIVVSPIFPVLLLYYPLRNTAKIWLGEFFRWLLYAPLFAIFLGGLVSLWQRYIPLQFQFDKLPVGSASDIIYPTGINILLGGPGQFVTQDNSVNLTETFALYVVALIMLWIVIILPFILLQIFLDYLSKFSLAESNLWKQVVNTASFNKFSPSPSPVTPGPTGIAPTGIGRSLPFGRKMEIPQAIREQTVTPTQATIPYVRPVMQSSQVNSEIMKLTNLSVPTMRDVARYETTLMSRDRTRQSEVTKIKETLMQISNPALVTSTTDRERYQEIRERLVQESQKGNVVAANILNAANSSIQASSNIATSTISQMQQVLQQIANPAAIASATDKERVIQIKEMLTRESHKGNQLATTVLNASKVVIQTQTPVTTEELKKVTEEVQKAKAKGNPVATIVSALVARSVQKAGTTSLPATNRVQSVSLDDYEAVKKMWQENYKTLDVPQSINGEQVNRAQWVQDDIGKISQTIDLLTSTDAEKVKEGMDQVANILPFLLIGGFSQTEIIAYLKAKQEAAKSILEDVKSKQEDEETTVERNVRKAETQKQMHVSAQVDTQEDNSFAATTTDEKHLNTTNTSQIHSATTGALLTSKSVQINAEILNLANLTLPKMHDIARYESSLLSRDEVRRKEANKIEQTLTNISNPEHVVDRTEREKYTQLRETLLKESQQGNTLASSILSAAGILSSTSQVVATQTPVLQYALTLIAHPEAVIEQIDRGQLVGLKELLTKESEKGNQLATAILSTAKATSEKIQQNATADVQNIMQQISNPQGIKTPLEKEYYTSVKETVLKESQKGNQLATSILSITDTSQARDVESVVTLLQQAYTKKEPVAVLVLALASAKQNQTQTQKIKEQLLQAKAKGDSLATKVLSYTDALQRGQSLTKKNVIIPQTNRIQSVSLDDYESVKKMWEESYRSLDVPQGIGEKQVTREQWVKDDTRMIAETISLLASSDQQKVKEGMEQVSNILPFLLIGGFSQTEVIAYLKAKQEAAKSVSEELISKQKDEETTVERSMQQHAKDQKQMHATSQVSKATSKESTFVSTTDFNDISNTASKVSSSATPVSSTPVQIDTKILNLTSLTLPKMRDIARYESSLLSQNQADKKETAKIQSTLVNIAKPEQITDLKEREKYIQLRNTLVKESQQGNSLAASILSAAGVSSTPHISVQTPVLQYALTLLLNPEVAIVQSDREQTATLREMITTESQKGNNVATSVLNTAKIASEKATQNTSSDIQKTMQSINNPQTVQSFADTSYFTALKETLQNESQKGNQLATTLLSVTDKSSVRDVENVATQLKQAYAKKEPVAALVLSLASVNQQGTEKLKEQLLQAKAKGDPLATKVLSYTGNLQNTAKKRVIIPQTNRLQSVSLDDYESVKRMWQDSYRSLDVPQHADGKEVTRNEWIADDVEHIGKTISLLASSDQQKVKEGMEQVANILPFLLIGGFSQTEIIAYLKAKQEAAKSTLEEVVAKQDNEATTVTVEKKKSDTTQSTQTAHVEEQNVSSQSTATVRPGATQATEQIKQVNKELLQLTNLSIPTVKDIVRYETALLSGNEKQSQDTQKVLETLEGIAAPTALHDTFVRDRFIQLRDRLEKESERGNPISLSLLSAAQAVAATDQQALLTTTNVQDILKQMANPTILQSTEEKERLNRLNNTIVRESQNGNSLAVTILSSMHETANTKEMEEVKEQLIQAQNKKDPVAHAIVSYMQASAKNVQTQLPSTNRIQSVSLDDYESVKKMWEETYRNLEVPPGGSGEPQTREQWIQGDIDEITETMNLLASGDQQKVKEGMERVSDILPFLLIGGFTQTEVIAYLKAKLEAAKTVLAELKEKAVEDETLVSADKKKTKGQGEEHAKSIAVEKQSAQENEEKKKEKE